MMKIIINKTKKKKKLVKNIFKCYYNLLSLHNKKKKKEKISDTKKQTKIFV